ncbi:MAG: hypothetical protein AB7I27_16380 [Bacteriovoracaceae bacterium]
MKNLKPIILGTLTLLNTSVFAADSIGEQITRTQEAIRVGLEEINQGAIKVPDSYDAKIKMEEFNQKAKKALARYEEAVRIRVLQSMNVLIAQYNSMLKSPGVDKKVLENLYNQIKDLAEEKNSVYKTAWLELYSILPDVPVMMKVRYFDGLYLWKYSTVKKHMISDDENFYHYELLFNFAQSGVQSRNFILKEGYYNSSYEVFLNKNSSDLKLTADFEVRKDLLKGCYSSTCYYLTQSQISVWRGLVESTLGQDIVIRLDDGKTINITKDERDYRSILGRFLGNITTEGLINNLPVEVSEERYQILTQVDAELKNNSCRKAKKVAQRLCTESREGCLLDSEKALLNDRFSVDCF